VSVGALPPSGEPGVELYSYIAEDITDQARAADALLDSEGRLRMLINAMPDFVCFKDGDGRWMVANDYGAQLFGLKPTEYRGKTNSELAAGSKDHKASFDILEAGETKAWEAGYAVRDDETILQPDGTKLILDMIRVPTFATDGRRKAMVIVGRDVTERHLADEAVKARLSEKEVMLKEIHHRVKNNLQVVTSLLSLQAQSLPDGQTRNVLRESQRRVRSMAMIHERLYRSEDLARVDLQEYMRGVARDLINFYGKNGVQCIVEGDTVKLGIDEAVPCGLIVNELVSNSLKHGYPANRSGMILMTIKALPGKKVSVSVSDDGVGYPSDTIVEDPKTMGMTLIVGLTSQLGGTITLDRTRGTTFTLVFPSAS
jgi:PAS domain S-box-containing protein